MDRKRRDSERRKAFEALIKRPNVLPWRRKPTDEEEKGSK
jgi:hypothetical protein